MKELSKREIKIRQRCEKVYNEIAPELELLPTMTVDEQVRKLVFAADEVFTEICESADAIKIDMLQEAQTFLPIARPQWNEFVKLAVESANGTITDKKLTKLQESFEESIFVTSQRMKFVDTFVKSHGSNKIELPEREQEIPLPELDDLEMSEDFENLLHRAVSMRTIINSTLWPKFANYSDAFRYITDFKYDDKHFKDLVDMYHYRDGGYPSENSPSKLWSIIDKFSYITKLMQEFKFEQIDNELDKFGITIDFKES